MLIIYIYEYEGDCILQSIKSIFINNAVFNIKLNTDELERIGVISKTNYL